MPVVTRSQARRLKEAPCPWDRLPDELKVEILTYCLKMTMSEAHRHKRKVLSLFLTSKRIHDLSLEIWNKNTFELRFWPRIPCQVPLPRRGCQNLLISFPLMHMLTLRESALKMRSYDYQAAVWRRLFRSPLQPTRFSQTDWQRYLPNLRQLVVEIMLPRRPLQSNWNPSCFMRNGEVDFSMNAGDCPLRADHVIVRVVTHDGSVCYSTEIESGESDLKWKSPCSHRCIEKIADGLKTLMERPKQVAEQV